MSYAKQTWVDNTTPLSAARMNTIENGIAAAAQFLGAGTSLPATGVGPGDHYYHTGLDCFLAWTGTAWRQLSVPAVADNTARGTLVTNYSSILPEGFRIWHTGQKIEQRWDATNSKWKFRLSGLILGATSDATGIYTFAHGGGQTPFAYGFSPRGDSTDAQSTVTTTLDWGADATNLSVRFVRNDTHIFFTNPGLAFSWWADF